MKHLATILLLLLAICAVATTPENAALRVGVLAYRPKPQALAQWQPLTKYLEKALGQRVELAVYNHAELTDAAAQRVVDVLITTANHSILLQHTAGVSAPLATLLTREDQHELSGYGGTILARADRDDIRSLDDLAGKLIAAVSTEAFGGFQTQAAELVEAGLPGPAGERLHITGQPHDRVIEAVLEGRADAGFVRTGVIEAMAKEGRLDQRRIKIINRQNVAAFPYAVSTNLYPEWPVAVMPQVDEKTASRLAAALFLLPRNQLGYVAGFTTPANYAGVESLMRSLRLPPFVQVPEIRLRDLWRHYAEWILALSGLVLLLAAASAGLVALYRRSRQSEAILHEQKELLSSVVENIPDMIFIKEARELRFVRLNKAGEALLGYNREDMIGKNDYDFFPQEQADFFTGKDRQVLESGQPTDILEEVIATQGGLRALHTKKIPILDRRGASAYLLGISEDITERKRTEEALRSSDAELRILISAMTDVIFVNNSEGRYLKVPETNPSLLYKPSHELVGKTLHEIFPKDQADYFLSRIRQALDTQKAVNFEYCLPVESQVFWFNAMLSPISKDMTLMVARDVTELKQSEQALRDSRQRLDNIIANSPSAIYRCANDSEWSMEFLSAAITQITDYPADDFLNNRIRSYASLIHPDDLSAVKAAVSAALERHEHYEMDYRLIARNGTPRWVHEQGQGVFAPDGQLLCLDGVIFDITDQRKAEEEIHKLNRELEQRVVERTAELQAANKELDAFAYSVSHDLRAPLRHIDGFLDLLKARTATTLDEKSQHYMDNIAGAAKRMGTLIDDLLDFSRMGRNTMAEASVDLGALLQEVRNEFDSEIQGRDIDWRITELPVVTGDRAMLRMVLVNLLSNALKFTQKRKKTEIEIGSQPGPQIVVFVRDNGAGFDMQYANKLFGVFQRLHAADEFEGTGIGLANVQRIINRHGGKTWAEGKVDGGATFYFSLPQSAIHETAKGSQ